ncbi:MAG: exosortase E/protease, VPEID-CTERM system [Candidatus Binataceae bacterium]
MRATVRLGLLGLLLAAELTHLGLPILPGLQTDAGSWWWPLIWDGRLIIEALLCAAFATVFFSWPVFVDELRVSLVDSAFKGRNRWLALHLLFVTCVVGWLAIGIRGGAFTAGLGDAWFLGGLVILAAAAATWCAALFPYSFWSSWFVRSPGAFAAGAGIGVAARVSGWAAQGLWTPLQQYTFWTVELMLRMLGQQTVVDPVQSLLGTPHFSVYIAPACSGLEGIGLIVVFLTGYLWLFRGELRFPQSLLLIPAGIAIVWLLNSVRITALILLGGSLAQLAVEGFHTVVGWIFFNLTAIGLVITSRQTSFFADTKSRAAQPLSANPAAPYLVPLIVTIATAMITAGFFHGFDFAYPVRMTLTAAALWLYRGRFKDRLWSWSWPAAGFGALTFVLWILLAGHGSSTTANTALADRVHRLPTSFAFMWFAFRLAGAVIIVPLAEELAFRGYLMRRLISSGFESIPYSHVSLFAVTVSSVLFGLLHQNWIAATIAGLIYAAAAYRRGRLSEAICAHATTNAMLALFVIVTGLWSLWT